MLPFLVRRLLWAIVLFLAATIITYVLFYVLPSDPASQRCGKACSEEDVQRVRELYHLDESVVQQYGRFLWELVGHQSLGRSFLNGQDVNELIKARAPVTATLVFGGAILWLTLAIPIGIFSALRPRSLLDRMTTIFVLIGISAHPVWIGLILAYLFGFKWGVTPITGYCDFFNPGEGASCGGPVQWAYHMILPWVTFALLFTAQYVRFIRASVMETLSEDYVRTARAKGAPESRVMGQHVLRNSLLPIVTILGLDISLALGGAIFTESIFGLPGLGQAVFRAVNVGDLPIIQGVVVFSCIAVIVFTIVVDMLYAVLDPRIRLA
ncbi:MAG: ABC transporter permease [Gaiella sp.]